MHINGLIDMMIIMQQDQVFQDTLTTSAGMCVLMCLRAARTDVTDVDELWYQLWLARKGEVESRKEKALFGDFPVILTSLFLITFSFCCTNLTSVQTASS